MPISQEQHAEFDKSMIELGIKHDIEREMRKQQSKIDEAKIDREIKEKIEREKALDLKGFNVEEFITKKDEIKSDREIKVAKLQREIEETKRERDKNLADSERWLKRAQEVKPFDMEEYERKRNKEKMENKE